jgi:hypothetical protein
MRISKFPKVEETLNHIQKNFTASRKEPTTYPSLAWMKEEEIAQVVEGNLFV